MRKHRVGLEWLQGNGSHAQELMSVDSEYELGRLTAKEKLLEAIAKSKPNDEQLFLSHADAFVPST